MLIKVIDRYTLPQRSESRVLIHCPPLVSSELKSDAAPHRFCSAKQSNVYLWLWNSFIMRDLIQVFFLKLYGKDDEHRHQHYDEHCAL